MGLGSCGDGTLVLKSVLEHLTRKKKDLCTVTTIILGYLVEVTQNQPLKCNMFNIELQRS